MNSMYFNEKNRDLMMKFIKNLCDMSYDYKEYYNDIHIKPEDCGAFPWNGLRNVGLENEMVSLNM